MRTGFLPLTILGLYAAALIGIVLYPNIDLIVSGWFYQPGLGFPLANHPLFIALHVLAVKGAWALGTVLLIALSITALRRSTLFGYDSKTWLFLLLALALGPVLTANVGLKDHWGRARPREVVEFGGAASFSPALIPQATVTKNGSFVSGDGSFGFYLPCFAYLVPLGSGNKRSRRVFWTGIGAGCVLAFDRIAMGGHFLSDNLFAALLMLLIGTGLRTLMYGRSSTTAYWRDWLRL